ncbi:MAG: hypothetical protein HY868_20175 [Chloroflexi bacterium]|nr:hypothetical protein [Chloroflexota bacterium]
MPHSHRAVFLRSSIFGCVIFLLSACASAPTPTAPIAPTLAPTRAPSATATFAPTATPTLSAIPTPTFTPTITPTPAPDTTAALALARAQIKGFNEQDFSVRADWLADKRVVVVIQSKTLPNVWMLLPGAKELTQVPTSAGIDNNVKLDRFAVENGKIVAFTAEGTRVFWYPELADPQKYPDGRWAQINRKEYVRLEPGKEFGALKEWMARVKVVGGDMKLEREGSYTNPQMVKEKTVVEAWAVTSYGLNRYGPFVSGPRPITPEMGLPKNVVDQIDPMVTRSAVENLVNFVGRVRFVSPSDTPAPYSQIAADGVGELVIPFPPKTFVEKFGYKPVTMTGYGGFPDGLTTRYWPAMLSGIVLLSADEATLLAVTPGPDVCSFEKIPRVITTPIQYSEYNYFSRLDKAVHDNETNQPGNLDPLLINFSGAFQGRNTALNGFSQGSKSYLQSGQNQPICIQTAEGLRVAGGAHVNGVLSNKVSWGK